MKGKIMLVDDEEGIIAMLKDYFTINEYEVITARNGTQALEKIHENPDIILLDINMPDLNGFEVCKCIRSTVDCPIIFLTAKIDPDDIVTGLSFGGDDYITKPFLIKELGSRVEAHLRRERRLLDKASEGLRGLNISYLEMTVQYDGKNIPVTKTEFAIIELLSTHPGQIFDRERIYENVRGYDAGGDNTVITEHIRKIRAKFIEVGCVPCIETVWGVGYKWVK